MKFLLLKLKYEKNVFSAMKNELLIKEYRTIKVPLTNDRNADVGGG